MLYADYNGSAPLLPEVKTYLHKRLDSSLFANPNAIHSMGQRLNQGIEKSREIIAKALGAYPDQVLFTSGSSESISTVLTHLLARTENRKKYIYHSPIEHAAVMNGLEFYKTHLGYELKELKISVDGLVDMVAFEKDFKSNSGQTQLVVMMSANNETGVIQPVEQMSKLCQAAKVPFFSDTTQSIGKSFFNFQEAGMDFAVGTSHKIGALIGGGFILARDFRGFDPLVFGGGQEHGLRGGTQNYLAIETMAVALDHFSQNANRLKALQAAREKFEKEIKAAFPEVKILGEGAKRLPGTTMISYPGIHGQAVQIELESEDIFVTTSAACSDNQPETSAVLAAMGVADDIGRGVIRISLSYSHGEEDYSRLVKSLKSAYTKLRKLNAY